jgi:hypothetical protein
MMNQLVKTFVAALMVVFMSQMTRADDFDEVSGVVGKYFTGTEEGRPELLKEVFLPSLEVQYVKPDGSLGRITAGDFISRFKQGVKADRKGRIVHMDVVGSAAVVKAEIIMGQRLYTDYLLLLKLDGMWRVSNKIATYRIR